MPEVSPQLDEFSVVLVWTAIAIYALAFIAFTLDLARRSQLAVQAKDEAVVREREFVIASARSANAAGASGATAGGTDAAAQQKPRYVFARIGMVLTVLAFAFHLGGTVMRGVAAGRVPWSNMYEFAMTGTLLMTAVFLFVNIRRDLRFLGTFMTGLIVALFGGASMSYYVTVVPLMDPLRSAWLVIHVFVATLGTAFFALAFALSVLQLLQARRDTRKIAAAAAGISLKRSFLQTLPAADKLEGLAYRFTIVGFVFWTFTLIAGAIWAQDAWGRYWGFDVKEVWTFIIWVLYAGYIHARATRGWRGTRSAWLSIIGFLTVLFNFTIVNQFFKGLHSYSGLS